MPFRAQDQAQPLVHQPAGVADLAVIRTVIGYAPAPPALLQGAAHDVAVGAGAAVASSAPEHLAPVLLPVEIFDAEELLG
jgi:hypothetical protein